MALVGISSSCSFVPNKLILPLPNIKSNQRKDSFISCIRKGTKPIPGSKPIEINSVKKVTRSIAFKGEIILTTNNLNNVIENKNSEFVLLDNFHILKNEDSDERSSK